MSALPNKVLFSLHPKIKDIQCKTKNLKEKYETLVTFLKEDMPHAIESKMTKNDLVSAIDLKIALDYYEELRFIEHDFFKGVYSFSLDLHEGKHTYTTNRRFQGKRLGFSSTLHKDIKNNPTKLLACLTFSVCYSSMYKASLTPRLKEASEEFYYLLKTAKPLPLLNEKSLGEVKEYVKTQIGILDI
ncbi:MAG: hypothetical protein AB7U45_17175, partial [Desulfamplus sp.]